MNPITLAPALGAGAALRILDSFAEAAPVWRALEEHGHCSLFQSLDWVREWDACVGRAHGVRPLLVLVEGPDGEPWMLLPLGLARRRFARVLVWLGGEFSDYLGPLIGPRCPPPLLGDGFRPLWQRVVNALPAFDYAHLQRMPARVGGVANPFLTLGTRENASRSHHTDLGADWDSYYRSKYSSRTRQQHRRRVRQIEEHGEIEFLVADEPELIDEVLDALLAQKSRFYHELGVPDLFASPARREFIRRMAHRHPPLIHVTCLRIGGRIWATKYAFRYRGHYHDMISSYERGELTGKSPGALLLRKVLEWCCSNGVAVYDFGVGDEPYKMEWSERETTLHECVLPRSAWGHVCTSALGARLHVKRRIKSSPWLWPLALRVRARLFGRPDAGREASE